MATEQYVGKVDVPGMRDRVSILITVPDDRRENGVIVRFKSAYDPYDTWTPLQEVSRDRT